LGRLGKPSSGVTKSQKMTCWGLPNSGFPGESSSGVTKSRKMTYRSLANSGLTSRNQLTRPRKVIFRDLVMLESHLGKPEKMI
jgi:hypothetical protein